MVCGEVFHHTIHPLCHVVQYPTEVVSGVPKGSLCDLHAQIGASELECMHASQYSSFQNRNELVVLVEQKAIRSSRRLCLDTFFNLEDTMPVWQFFTLLNTQSIIEIAFFEHY